MRAPGPSPEGRPSVKFGRMLAQTAFNIALIVFIFSGTAVARTPSLAIPEPMQIEVFEKAPVVDMGFYPIDSDPTRKSLIWNAFPEPLNVEIFEKAPVVDMGFYPIDSEPIRKSLIWNAVREPLNVEVAARMPSEAIREPMQVEVAARMPSEAIREPMQAEVAARMPSEAVREPMQAEVAARMPSEAVREPMQAEVAARMPSEAIREPMQAEVAARMPSEAIREPLNIECCGPTMRFDLKKAVSAEILIYSVDGRLVRRLSEALPNGESSVTWDGRDNRGTRAASGVYFARVQANEETGKGKLVLVR